MLSLWKAWASDPGGLTEFVDQWFANIGREVYLSLSTIYSQLRFLTRQLQAGHALFAITPFSPHALCGLINLDPRALESAILHPAFGLASSLRIDPPP